MMPSKTDINPSTGKAYAINPSTGVWDDNYWANTVEPQLKAQYGGGVGGGTLPTTGTLKAPDLTSMYTDLSNQNGISTLEQQIANKQAAYTAQQAKINDNPFLSEASRVGRNQRLTSDFNANIANDQTALAQKKADVNTQLGLATQQFSLDSQAVQQGLNQFNSLLNAGALNNASPATISTISQQTGLSADMIQSAVNAKTAADQPKPQIIPYDDGTNQGYVVVNPTTGQIINKQVIGTSKILGTAQDKVTTGTGPKITSSENKSAALQQLPIDFQQGWTLGTAMQFYESQGLTPQQIYNAYKTSSRYYQEATPQQHAQDQARYNVK